MTELVIAAWYAAVEELWYYDGPAALTARRVHQRATSLSQLTESFPTIKHVIYDLKDPDGNPMFGSVQAVVQAAHDNAVADLRVLVDDTTSRADKYDGIGHYVAALIPTPCRRKMMATMEGPAGRAKDLWELHQRLTRYLGDQGRVAAVHGVIEGFTAGLIAYPTTAIQQIIGGR